MLIKRDDKNMKTEKKIDLSALTSQLPTWIETLQKAAQNEKNWCYITGYSGGLSEDEKHVVIYLDNYLWQAINIPTDAILHFEKSQQGLDGLVHVWIDDSKWCECKYTFRS